jgi:hypothetical protein
MSEFFKNRIDTAHALIDEQDYDTPVEILLNLKTRIHDTDLLTKINMHDTEVEKEFQTRYMNISQKGGDPYDSFKQVLQLKKWRAQEFLKYYDMIIKENDVQ